MNKIDLAVVGCGYVADYHLRAWKKVRNARVVAVCDLKENMARNVARLWKISEYYTSFPKLLEQRNIDLIDICTPPHTHASLAVQAMKSNFHVLLEKPMTMTVKEAHEILDCQRTKDVKVGVIHNMLYEPPFLRVSSMVETGYVGDILSVEVEMIGTKYDPMCADEHHWCHNTLGGRFGELLTHPIYSLQHFLGSLELEGVWTSKVDGYPWMKTDELCAILKAGKKWGRIYVSFNSARPAVFINIYGSKVILRLDAVNATITTLSGMATKLRSWDKIIDSLRQASQLAGSTARNALSALLGRWRNGHETYIKLFAESLINGKDPPVASYKAYETVKILEQMCREV